MNEVLSDKSNFESKFECKTELQAWALDQIRDIWEPKGVRVDK
jgi:hypothetical protein